MDTLHKWLVVMCAVALTFEAGLGMAYCVDLPVYELMTLLKAGSVAITLFGVGAACAAVLSEM